MSIETSPALADEVVQWFTDSEFRQEPYEFFDRLRASEPVHRCDAVDAWVVTDFNLGDEVFRRSPVLRNPENADMSYMYDEAGELRATWRLDMGTHRWRDGEDHNRYRRLVSQVMNPRSIRGWHDQIQALLDVEVERLLDGPKETDLIADFVYGLPMQMICAVLGIPGNIHGDLSRWTEDWFAAVQPATPPDVARRGDEAAETIERHVRALVELKRGDPDEGMLSLLIRARDDEDRLTDPELVSITASILGAGHETTGSMIGNATLALLRNPDEFERLRHDPDRLAGEAVEESLRYEGAAMLAPRYAVQDFELGGQSIRSGDTIYVIMQAAGRSPSTYEDPNRFWLERPDKRHLGFAMGPHFCPGAQLARVELRLALSAIASRFPGLTLEADDLRWRPGLGIRGLEALPVSWN